ncbi:hypothetical protein GBAR_LOCUS12928 [Geodia barretti]|uniref:Uncharacterized protein n=1 Tax=Geodia barretti TaxID=519541 RepID=A0AA35WM53_GEOBA|nr:hypothetical protein GBAR_LOCUS12928 [Geodia barretti]
MHPCKRRKSTCIILKFEVPTPSQPYTADSLRKGT